MLMSVHILRFSSCYATRGAEWLWLMARPDVQVLNTNRLDTSFGTPCKIEYLQE